MSGGLLQLSGVVVDLVHQVDHLPAPGEEVETPTFQMTAGGGFNAMAAARRMGVTVTYGGVLGTGPLAEIAMRGLDAEGISLSLAKRAPIDQGSCAVIVDHTGERSFITHHGAEREIDLTHLGSLHARRQFQHQKHWWHRTRIVDCQRLGLAPRWTGVGHQCGQQRQYLQLYPAHCRRTQP